MNHTNTNAQGIDADPTDILPFCSQQAVTFSEYYAVRYLADHSLPKTGLDERLVTRLATARLEWLLSDARERLSGQFSSGDISLLMNCYQDILFFPDQVRSFASDLCDDLGIEADKWEQSAHAPLLRRLFALSQVEKLAMADALEQAWHRMGRDNVRHEATFEQLGIKLVA